MNIMQPTTVNSGYAYVPYLHVAATAAAGLHGSVLGGAAACLQAACWQGRIKLSVGPMPKTFREAFSLRVIGKSCYSIGHK